MLFTLILALIFKWAFMAAKISKIHGFRVLIEHFSYPENDRPGNHGPSTRWILDFLGIFRVSESLLVNVYRGRNPPRVLSILEFLSDECSLWPSTQSSSVGDFNLKFMEL